MKTNHPGFLSVKGSIRKLIRRFGLDLVRYPAEIFGVSPTVDMQYFLRGEANPLILDVGANIGQSVDAFKEAFPGSTIHSFEPSPGIYEKLSNHCRGIHGVKTWNFGVGSRPSKMPFLENDRSEMSSFLAPGRHSSGNVVKETQVEILTLDGFAAEHEINFVHILKTDTQGYDFEVLKGAEGLIKGGKIALVYFEFIFNDMYQGLPSFHEVFQFLSDRNYSLVTFYQPHLHEHVLGWADMLFINNDFSARRIERNR